MKLLDLFCGGGGSAKGYSKAGYDVFGVDNKPQPHYPFKMVVADALMYALAFGRNFDAIHASPPCPGYSHMTPDKSKHKTMIPITRKVLEWIGKPYIIENVPGARRELISPIMLCGRSFGLKVYRHRYFETNPELLFMPHHVPHKDKTPSAGHGISPNGFMSVAGHFSQVAYAQKAMGMDWGGQKELAQAIPPAYTYWLGTEFMKLIRSE